MGYSSEMFIKKPNSKLKDVEDYPAMSLLTQKRLPLLRKTLHEPRKKPSYFPLNPGWLIGILTMVYFYPYITGQYNPLYSLTNQGFFHCSHEWNLSAGEVPKSHPPQKGSDFGNRNPHLYFEEKSIGLVVL